MSFLYVFNPTSPPKTTTTCTNGLITAQWPEPHTHTTPHHTTPHNNKHTHHTKKHAIMWHTSLFWALQCAWWHSCYHQSKWDSTIHHDSTSSILDGDRYCHSIQNRSSPFATEWSIQIDKNTSRTELCCQAVFGVLQHVLCNMFQRIAPGRTRQGSWLSGALFLNNALPTSHNKWCTSQS